MNPTFISLESVVNEWILLIAYTQNRVKDENDRRNVKPHLKLVESN